MRTPKSQDFLMQITFRVDTIRAELYSAILKNLAQRNFNSNTWSSLYKNMLICSLFTYKFKYNVCAIIIDLNLDISMFPLKVM